MLDQLANRLMTLQIQHPVRVAVDGVDAAGKTTLADELAALLIQRDRPVIRASIDGFHRPRAERHRQGATSPQGYYTDSFDYDA
jgi:uridine kinase